MIRSGVRCWRIIPGMTSESLGAEDSISERKSLRLGRAGAAGAPLAAGSVAFGRAISVPRFRVLDPEVDEGRFPDDVLPPGDRLAAEAAAVGQRREGVVA